MEIVTVSEEDKKQFAAMMDPTKAPVPIIRPPTPQQEQFDKDYEYTQKKLKQLADVAEEAIGNFKEIAKETAEPSAYRVLGELIAANREVIRAVIETAKDKASIDDTTGGRVFDDGKAKTITNNTTVFVGTTKDIIKKVMAEEEARKVIDVVPVIIHEK